MHGQNHIKLSTGQLSQLRG